MSAAEKQSLLIELGTEELPPKALKELSRAFSEQLLAGLREAELISDTAQAAAQSFATPRRLALLVPEVLAAQPNQDIERRGPALAAAFDDNDQPTPAAMGFAKSCGVEVDDLQRLKTDQREWLSYKVQQVGKSLSDLLPEILERTIKRLPIPKRMRWGSGNAEFVRPAHWLVVMHGATVLPVTVLDLLAGNCTRGHRFHCEGDIEIDHADNYERLLDEQGSVIASFTARKKTILEQVTAVAAKIDAHIEDDQSLLDEVTALVEYPVAVLGEFDAEFLQVPPECLISSMRDHQKYFHVRDADDALLPNFVTVSNIRSKHPERVRQGNERVLRARLADAQFFWQTDLKQTLESRVEKLASVLFHVKLGNVLDKSKRVQALAGKIAASVGADAAITERAALLVKADLVSNMVGEFDHLQGIMGHYYADLDQEPPLVGEVIEQHYWPKFAGDRLPESPEAQAIALADRVDSLVGLIGAGEKPSGDKDRYALRRAALGIIRILIERQQPLNLSELVATSAEVLNTQQNFSVDDEVQAQIVDFIRDRLTAYYQGQGVATNTINAVMSCKPDSPLDFDRRITAVKHFAELPEASDLAAANKRISNILKKQAQDVNNEVEESLLVEAAEQKLHNAIETIAAECTRLFDSGDYSKGLQKLAGLRSPIDDFFEHVMVMSDDAQQQANRLAMLKKIQQLFLRVADISQLDH